MIPAFVRNSHLKRSSFFVIENQTLMANKQTDILLNSLGNRNIKIADLDKKETTILQSLLIQAGFLPAKSNDGIPGPQTQKAFASFKESIWLGSPELLGRSSFKKLIEVAGEAGRAIPSQESNHAIPSQKSNAIITGGSFTWDEATHNGTREPQSNEVREGIIRLARQIQPIRDRIGQPFIVTSWYRPDAINRRVGGARFSRHLSGDAMDFSVKGKTGLQIAQYFKDWSGGVGIYRSMPFVCHVDARPGKARWGGAPW